MSDLNVFSHKIIGAVTGGIQEKVNDTYSISVSGVMRSRRGSDGGSLPQWNTLSPTRLNRVYFRDSGIRIRDSGSGLWV